MTCFEILELKTVSPSMFTMIFSSLVAFAGLRGFAEIIEKLHRNEIHQKAIYELLKEQNTSDNAPKNIA